jgi:hypothetical protein
MVGLTLVAWLAVAAGAAGTVASPAVDELSGLAVSGADATVLWGHNDSGDGAVLYRMGLQGEDLGRIVVEGAHAGDWEDLAAFRHREGPALLVADTGDNFGMRTFSTLYAVLDPGRGDGARLLWRLDFRFADGERDCEGVAVDPLAREILLLSKRDDPPRLYRLPLPDAPPREQQVAELLGPIAPLPPRPLHRRLARRYAYAPTAFDISADGLTAVIASSVEARVYRRRPGESWLEVLRNPGQPVPLAGLESVEAAALSADGRILYLGAEGRPGRWWRIALP